MQLRNDINQLPFLTADMDRLMAFYERIFEAPVTLDMEEEGLRHISLKSGRAPYCTQSGFRAWPPRTPRGAVHGP